jgi:hypothetical protein
LLYANFIDTTPSLVIRYWYNTQGDGVGVGVGVGDGVT